MTRAGWIVSFIVGVMVALMWWALISASIAANASSVSRAHAFEIAFNLFPGRMIVVPQLNGTVKYLRTETRRDGTYAVVFQPMD